MEEQPGGRNGLLLLIIMMIFVAVIGLAALSGGAAVQLQASQTNGNVGSNNVVLTPIHGSSAMPTAVPPVLPAGPGN